LADKILLMSNGPQAVIAEIVENTMPKSRSRTTMHHDPQFYSIRNHLIDFLVKRAKAIASGQEAKPQRPVVVRPGLLPKAA
jgi:nitrate/nitrite transport system ATP-binding protein